MKDVIVEQFVIVSLDLGTETYDQYRLPHDFYDLPPIAPIVNVLGGFLCCSYFYKETNFIIWEMKELGVEVEDSETNCCRCFSITGEIIEQS